MRLSKRYRLMVWWSVPCLVGALALGYVAYRGSERVDPAARNADGSVGGLTSVLDREIAAEMVRFRFEEVAKQAGISCRHFPDQRNSLLPEDMGSGLAWGDYDQDGDADLFLVNFRSSILSKRPNPASVAGRCALYRNNGDGSFTDVSKAARVDLALFGMGAAWGDYDNDSDLDLYVTAYGPNHLLENDGHGTFSDVTESAGVGDTRFSAGCAWCDYDRDGWIDLYVCTYTKFEYPSLEPPVIPAGVVNPHTINPSSYEPDTNCLYHNRGDGTFEEIAATAGVDDPNGRSLGVTCFDFDIDGWVDLYVANDVSTNAVLRNRGDGTFEDIGASSLAADYRGAMGMAVNDLDHDRDFDLFVTHWEAQENALYLNQFSEVAEATLGSGDEQRLFFTDSSEQFGTGQISLRTVGWATSFADFDNDGFVDLWVVNGSTLQFPDDARHMEPQRMHIFRQLPPRGFFEVGVAVCAALEKPFVGRGGAEADYDGDGRVDLAVVVHAGQPLLLHNTSPEPGHWITVRLRQTDGNTQALGAVVRVETSGVVQSAQVGASGSYLSQPTNDLHFGLGSAQQVDRLTITWPDGREQQFENVAADRLVEYHRS